MQKLYGKELRKIYIRLKELKMKGQCKHLKDYITCKLGNMIVNDDTCIECDDYEESED